MIPKRPYGKKGDQISIIGLGGIVLARLPQREADAIAREAYERGVNYFDVAPTYWDAEERMGAAIKPFRDKLFLACKTAKRDAKGAQEELEASLRKLQTDYFDLYQLHALSNMEELEQCFAPGGAMEVFLKAREQGKVRYIGFSAHAEEVALEALKRFPFDSVLFPFNFVMLFKGNFGWELLREAPKRGATLLALKAMARTQWQEGAQRLEKCWYEPITDPKMAELAFRYTLSLPNMTAAIPPGEENLFRMALPFAERFRKVSAREMQRLRAEAEKLTPLFSRAA
ncbi:MAG: aldo/keto reductase [Armatimonadota bacterium]|nr:aldo/keto reductase [bacterium]MCS7309343.1 aldo/keto reductase [Armatimonadota bacterium]MDW8289603.1 aldo/keto reductase [Armatimonadota bacterium]